MKKLYTWEVGINGPSMMQWWGIASKYAKNIAGRFSIEKCLEVSDDYIIFADDGTAMITVDVPPEFPLPPCLMVNISDVVINTFYTPTRVPGYVLFNLNPVLFTKICDERERTKLPGALTD
jgi:hypothetical protein